MARDEATTTTALRLGVGVFAIQEKVVGEG
jgi:hypothetical protein